MKHYGDICSKEIVTNLVRRLTFVQCDKCKRKIVASDHNEKDTMYIKVHTWHNDWGNDSVDSHEYYDFCNVCAIEFVSSYILSMTGSMEIACEVDYAWSGDKDRTVTRKDGYDI